MQLNGDEKQLILSKKQGRSLDSMYGHSRQRERERREPESQTASGYPMTSFREKKSIREEILLWFLHLLKLSKTPETDH